MLVSRRVFKFVPVASQIFSWLIQSTIQCQPGARIRIQEKKHPKGSKMQPNCKCQFRHGTFFHVFLPSRYPPGNYIMYPVPAGTFESMLFLFLRWVPWHRSCWVSLCQLWGTSDRPSIVPSKASSGGWKSPMMSNCRVGPFRWSESRDRMAVPLSNIAGPLLNFP